MSGPSSDAPRQSASMDKGTDKGDTTAPLPNLGKKEDAVASHPGQ